MVSHGPIDCYARNADQELQLSTVHRRDTALEAYNRPSPKDVTQDYILESQGEPEIGKQTSVVRLRSGPSRSNSNHGSRRTDSEQDVDEQFVSRYELLRMAKALEFHIEDNRQDSMQSAAIGCEMEIPHEVMFEFQKWIQMPRSKVLWTQGLPSPAYTSAISLLARQVCDIGLNLSIPCISVFLKRKSSSIDQTKDHEAHRKAACIALLYSLVSQLIQLLPHHFDADPNGGLGIDQFKSLDGSLKSANTALQMIDNLFDNATPVLMCVIDGIEWAESPATLPYLGVLLKIFRLQQNERMFKISFTTQTTSLVLQQSLDVEERVDASRMAQVRPGTLLRGGCNMLELNNSFYNISRGR